MIQQRQSKHQRCAQQQLQNFKAAHRGGTLNVAVIAMPSCHLFLCCAVPHLQFSLLEYFGPNGNPIGQFIGTVDASNPAELAGVKQTWMDPVRHLA
jgi:hypothetical protein